MAGLYPLLRNAQKPNTWLLHLFKTKDLKKERHIREVLAAFCQGASKKKDKCSRSQQGNSICKTATDHFSPSLTAMRRWRDFH
jgi:hypothetical protein